jgi:glycosyltransferase involved in cell wall biosynthesis
VGPDGNVTGLAGTVAFAPRAFPLFSVVVPMWNEEDSFDTTVGVLVAACEHLAADGAIETFELVLVDDASTDSTGARADAAAAADRRIRAVHHAENLGLGGSVRTGLAAARGDLVLYTDADLPFDLFELPRLVRLMQVYDAGVLSAWRMDRHSEGFRRTIYSAFYNMLVRALLRLRVRDVNFACKMMRREVLDDIELKSTGSFIDAELIARANRRGHKFIQVGVDYFARSVGVSTLSSFGTIRGILREMFAMSREIRHLQPASAPEPEAA